LGLEENMFSEEKAIIFGKGSSNGLDLSFFDPLIYSQESIAILKKDFGFNNKFIYGFVGRIVDRKGINELYSAFQRLVQEDSNSHLLIVGKANLEQVEDKTLMSKLENDDNVTLTGYVNNINDYMAVMDVFVLPAWWEGFGNTLIQSAAMGLPIISCNVTGCRDAVNDGYNGMLIEPKNENVLYDTMLNLKNNEAKRTELGNNGKIWAQNFDSKNIWEAMKELYESQN
jgi:glycosyltransferase involved in cell wall biosynthesis